MLIVFRFALPELLKLFYKHCIEPKLVAPTVVRKRLAVVPERQTNTQKIYDLRKEPDLLRRKI